MTKVRTHILTNDKNDKRAKLYEQILRDSSGEFSLVSIGPKFKPSELDLLVIISFQGLTEKQVSRVVNEVTFDERNFSVILDMPESFLLDEATTSSYLACSICSDIVITQDSEMQEATFRYCGILPHIIEDIIEADSVTLPEYYTKPMSEVKVGWYGLPIDLMSVKKELVSEAKSIDVITTKRVVGLSEARKQSVFNSTDELIKKLNKVDIIYLPKTYDYARELSRYLKVIDSVKIGKFVVAPDLELDVHELAFDDSLLAAKEYFRQNDVNLWVQAKQQILLETFNLKNATKALKEILREEYNKSKELFNACNRKHETELHTLSYP